MSKTPRNDTTAERVRSVLDYDPDTGHFRWKSREDVPFEWNTRRAGTIAGGRMAKGYIVIAISPRRYLAHRLAWLYVTGEWPKNEIDHVNGIRSDNRFCNLRDATNSENATHKTSITKALSGVRGVRFHTASGLWHARVSKDKREHSLGYFKTIEEAAEARRRGEVLHHRAFAANRSR